MSVWVSYELMLCSYGRRKGALCRSKYSRNGCDQSPYLAFCEKISYMASRCI